MASKRKITNNDESRSKMLQGKKKKEDDEQSSSSNNHESESNDTESDEPESEPENQEINIDFEGQNITEEDFHGIKMLLQQLLITMSVNISKLTGLITSQSGIGSTLKVIDDDEGTVYGLSTIIDFDKGKDFTKEMTKSLKEKCKESSKDNLSKMSELLEKRIGLFINERFINIPEHVAIPMLQSLKSEIEETQKEGSLPLFDCILFITKSVKPTKEKDLNSEAGEGSSSLSKKEKKKLKRRKEEELQFINQEDELFFKESLMAFNYSVTKATGFAVSGEWAFGDVAMDTYRTVMIMDYQKFAEIVQNIEELLS